MAPHGHHHGAPSAALALGWWAGLAVALFSIGFSVPGLLALAGVIGFPWDPVLADTSSLLLSWSFLVLMTALGPTVARGERVWTSLAAHLAVAYAVLVGVVYLAMSMATLVGAAALQEPADRWRRRVFVVNGVLGLPILASYMPLVLPWSTALLPVNALWVVSVPLCGVLAAIRFRRLRPAEVP